MLTSCMLWDALIMNIYPSLAKAEIMLQFDRFREQRFVEDMKEPTPEGGRGIPLGTPLGVEGSLDETAEAMSFRGISGMNSLLAKHENLTQALESFNAVILVYGLSNIDRLGFTEKLAHVRERRAPCLFALFSQCAPPELTMPVWTIRLRPNRSSFSRRSYF